jgi:outer membrane protein assembly factor BamB
VLAQFFALLLTVFQAPAAPPQASFDARWVTAFETPPSAPPGFDATTAYVPLAGQLVAVDLNRGTIRWRVDVATPFTPATGEGLVFTVTDQVIEARDAATGATKWQTPLPGGAAAPLYWDTGWLLASTTAGDLAAFRAKYQVPAAVQIFEQQAGALQDFIIDSLKTERENASGLRLTAA